MYKIYYLTSIVDCFQPRYVGYSSNDLIKRLKEHIYSSKYGKIKSYKSNWIRSLIKRNVDIQIVELDSAKTLEEVNNLERLYIESFNNWYKLTNSTNGGEFSKTYSEDVKIRISKSLKEYYKNNYNWLKGKTYKLSERSKKERRINLGDKINGSNNHFYGKSHSMETRLIISKKNRLHNYSYSQFYNFYIVELMDKNSISVEMGLSVKFVQKMITKYKLPRIKKLIYGKIKGNITKINDKELLYKYYDNTKI